MELNAETEERGKMIEKIWEKMGKWAGKDKLYEQMDSFTKFLSEQNQQFANFTVLKLDTKEKIITTVTKESDYK